MTYLDAFSRQFSPCLAVTALMLCGLGCGTQVVYKAAADTSPFFIQA